MEPRRNPWRGAGPAVLVAALVAWPMATACSGSSDGGPHGSGNDVINDTRDAEPRAPANPDPGDDSGPDAMGNPAYETDGGTTTYPGLAECGNCTCAASKGYCFGGAAARDVEKFHALFTPMAKGDAGAVDAGLPACPIVSGATPQLGCNALPTGCTTCGCIIAELQPSYSCYLVCASDSAGSPMTVYCPNG